MGIPDAEFDARAADLVNALAKMAPSPQTSMSTRKDILEARKSKVKPEPGEKKVEEKKPGKE